MSNKVFDNQQDKGRLRDAGNFPKVVLIDTVSYCNLKCSMCIHKDMSRKKGIMRWSLFTKIIEEIAVTDAGVRVWMIFFGEALILKRRKPSIFVKNAELIDTLVSQSDVVIHFAAETHVTRSICDNFIFFETDVLGTQTVANAVLKYKGRVERFIHISSSEVYGTAVKDKMDEDHPLKPLSPYASAKAGADRLVYSYWATYEEPVIIIRPFNNYGPFQHLEKAVPRFITSCILNEKIRVHGDGSASRDYIFVEDLCLAIDTILHADLRKVRGEVFNVASGTHRSILSIAKDVVRQMGKEESIIEFVGDRPGQVFRHT